MRDEGELPAWPVLVLGLIAMFAVILPVCIALRVFVIGWRMSLPVVLAVAVWLTWPS